MKYHVDGTMPEGPEIFVFGSNLAGIHGAGAALAATKRGARWGKGVGRWGDTYAIPTKDSKLLVLPIERIRQHVHRFLDYAALRMDEEFFITRIGCGLAGYRDEQIAPMFALAPRNCSVAEQWRKIIEDVRV